MAHTPKRSLVKKLLIVAGVLVVLQVAFIFSVAKKEKPLNIRQGIDKAMQRMQDLPSERREQMRVQLAVTDYMLANKGQPPKQLKDLVGKYFDSIPNDPATGKPFEYRVDGKKFYVGSGAATVAGEKGKDAPKGDAAQSTEEVMPGGVTKEEQKALIATLDETKVIEHIPYDPAGKKDPFRPFDVSPDLDVSSDTSPLERYEAARFKMTAILEFGGEPSAIIEDPLGKGHTVKKGSKIGLRGGEVIEIFADRVVVMETETDFTGETKSKTVDILMRGVAESVKP